MVYTERRPFKRGDVYFTLMGDSIGAEQNVGRPAVILDSEIGCKTSSVLNVVYVSSQYSKVAHNVEINCLEKRSWVRCNQFASRDVSRFTKYLGHLSEEEMRQVDQAILKVLGLPQYDGGAIGNVTELEKKAQKYEDLFYEMTEDRDYYRRLYEITLDRMVDARIKSDLAAPPAPVVEKPVAEKPVKERKKPGWKKKVVEEPKLTVSGKVNVNTCTKEDLIEIAGLSKLTAADIVVYRKKHGPYGSVEDLMNVKRFGKGCLKKYGGRLTVEEEKPEKEDDGLLNINDCSFDQMQGVGFSANLALNTIAARPFKSVEDLKFVPGMTQVGYRILSQKVKV